MDELKNKTQKKSKKKSTKVLLIAYLILAITAILSHIDRAFFFSWAEDSNHHNYLINAIVWYALPLLISSLLMILFYFKIKSEKKKLISTIILIILTIIPLLWLNSFYVYGLFHGAYNAKTYWQKVEKYDCSQTDYICPTGYEATFPPPCTDEGKYDRRTIDSYPKWDNWDGWCVNAHDCTCYKID